MTAIFGMGCSKNGFGFNRHSVAFTAVMIWFGGCFFGRELCSAGCDTTLTYKRLVILLLGIRLVQLGILACIIKFRCSNELLKQIHHLSNRLDEKNAGSISAKYRRRNFIFILLFSACILIKVLQLVDINSRVDEYDLKSFFLKYTCTYASTWPVMILNWQFLVWMQVFSGTLSISVDELQSSMIKWQKDPSSKYELQIFESVTQVKSVLEFKKKILNVYGPSIIICQLRACLWIVLNAYIYSCVSRTQHQSHFPHFVVGEQRDNGFFTTLGRTRNHIRGEFVTTEAPNLSLRNG